MLNPLDYLIVQMRLQAPAELAEQLDFRHNLGILGAALAQIFMRLSQALHRPSVSLKLMEDCEEMA